MIRVDESDPSGAVRWTVLSCDFLPDWVGTRPTFADLGATVDFGPAGAAAGASAGAAADALTLRARLRDGERLVGEAVVPVPAPGPDGSAAVSLALEAKAVKRTDVPDYPADWIVQGGAQLRFSLWAPPRREARSQDSL